MKTAEARVSAEILDSIQDARGCVPLREWRLRPDCAFCLYLAGTPATEEWNRRIRVHALDEHADEVVLDVERFLGIRLISYQRRVIAALLSSE